jgi:hypothetical protein
VYLSSTYADAPVSFSSCWNESGVQFSPERKEKYPVKEALDNQNIGQAPPVDTGLVATQNGL